jgi:hypothetical protein
LLEAEPSVGIIENGGSGVGDVRGAVRHHDFAHDESAIFAGGVGENRDGFEHAIGAAAGRLAGGAAIEAPQREVFELGKAGEFLDGGLAAEVCNGLVAIEPDVFEFVFSHSVCGVFF